MRFRKFNLLGYYALASSVVLVAFGSIYLLVNVLIHEKFILNNAVHRNDLLTQVEAMQNSLDMILLAGLSLLFVVLTLIIIRAQKIINAESSSIEKTTFLETVRSLVNAMEARDRYTKGHSLHVSKLCVLLTRHSADASKNGVDYNKIEFAGLLHDIGKIGIPESILNKDGRLDDTEWEMMKSHPEIGEQILRPISRLGDVPKWVFHHHEKVDGTGYPLGLRGTEIPLESRIIAVADTYSALTTDRPYRRGLTYPEALEIMNGLAGSQLDFSLMEVFAKIPWEEIEKCSVDRSDLRLERSEFSRKTNEVHLSFT